ncbi:MAG: ATP-grasp domain-containing protein [Candidatus Muiribacteriota bacterium]
MKPIHITNYLSFTSFGILMRKKRILVLNGESSIGYQTIRALAKTGKFEIYCGGSFIGSRGFASRYINGFMVYGRSLDERSFRKINQYIIKNNIDLLYPVFTDTIYFVNKHYNGFSKICNLAIFPDLRFLDKINDKEIFNRLVDQNGFNIPKTFFIKDKNYLREIKKQLKFPCILKPRKSHAGLGIKIVNSFSELEKEYLKLINVKSKSKILDYKMPILQEYIFGEEFAIQFIIGSEKSSIFIVSKRKKVFPDFGAPVHSIIVDKTPYLNIIKKCEIFLRKFNFKGITCMTFIRDQNGKDFFLESNPRLWSDMMLYSFDQFNIPGEFANLSLGNPLAYEGDYPSGEFISLLGFIARNIFDLNLNSFLMPFKKKIVFDFTINDPGPFLLFLLTRPFEILKKNKRWFL